MADQRRVERLPDTPHLCAHAASCVYGIEGVCDEPRINNQNYDSLCHKTTRWKVAAWLSPITPPATEGAAHD